MNFIYISSFFFCFKSNHKNKALARLHSFASFGLWVGIVGLANVCNVGWQ